MTKVKSRPIEPKAPELSSAMQGLIEEGYTLFDWPLRSPLALCTCPVCISEDHLEALQTRPVKELSAELVFEYLNAVPGEEDDYQIKHFLPRILDLVAHYAYIRVDDTLNLDKCHFESPIWSQEELDFMRRFSRQFILDRINQPPNQADALAVYLVMFDLAGLDTSHLLDLDLWLKEADPIKALWDLEEIYYDFTKDYAHFTYTFSVNPDFNQEMTDWLTSRELAQGFLPILEDYLLSDNPLTSEEEYRLEQLYRVFERQIKKKVQ